MVWIDGVFSGGGVKAFAFVGAYEVAEEAGFKFRRVAGTSAGSIIAAFIAAGYNSKEIFKLMEEMHPSIFLDQSKMIYHFPFIKWLTLYWRMGLYKGNKFEAWLKEVLKAKGVERFSDLPPDSLKIIASDLSRGKMVVIPDDLVYYGIHPENFSVARAIRMSCSLPFFFEPTTLFNKKSEKCIIVDGGVLSNFPVWLYDEENQLPLRPFLGFQLSSRADFYVSRRIKNAFDLFHGLFTTMKEAHDAKYISKYAASNIVFLPVENIETANFKLSKEEIDKLVAIGRKRTKKFLKHWTY
ncbi:NTE family protein [Pullulanibacillus pueri]|nr:NTE family protein [Pullulanibacillus pueri]